MSKLLFHADIRPEIHSRTKIFGHKNSMITLQEGFIAKKYDSRESSFYLSNQNEFSGIFNNFIPEFCGIIKLENAAKNQQQELIFHEELNFIKLNENETIQNVDNGNENDLFYILQKDISFGYSRTSILDLKVGIRAWRLNASQRKAARRTKKIQRGPNGIMKFRVRGCMFYDNEGTLDIYSRDFSERCTMEELELLFVSFFKFKKQISSFIDKLEKLKKKLIQAENQFQVRFYSSSIVFMYDEDDESKYDVRLLDFEKAYVHIDKEARECNVPLEECDDGLEEAITNIISQLKKLM
ncbi:Inositol polyphosphate kinase family protein [Tritrichomonas foetus]|uniref:Kinase n=1 Tax=Tritrichomonas foetus TaxID=1144522 RepID=A0A1J4JB84_9EUKA|nr:Inositol polyphosphate kinase family protein [Tritrichomonas foetus]|eukprot:OHS94508.1 Inositol polyphosphate kinase family protein [Tritrichomonas foetus]